MHFRVPLLNPMQLIVQRLLPQETWANPPDPSVTTGYDPDFREPVAAQAAGGLEVTDARVYGPELEIPCQLEIKTFEEIQMLEAGDDALTRVVFVLHRRDLEQLQLLDEETGNIILKKNDKIVRLEKEGRKVLLPHEELYICRIDPGSAGFGPDGYDLHIVLTKARDADVRGRG